MYNKENEGKIYEQLRVIDKELLDKIKSIMLLLKHDIESSILDTFVSGDPVEFSQIQAALFNFNKGCLHMATHLAGLFDKGAIEEYLKNKKQTESNGGVDNYVNNQYF